MLCAINEVVSEREFVSSLNVHLVPNFLFKSNLPFNSNLPIRPSSIAVVSSNESLTAATLSSTATIAKFSSTSLSCCLVNVANMAAIYEITEHVKNTTFYCNKMPWQICLDRYVPSSFSSRVKSLSS